MVSLVWFSLYCFEDCKGQKVYTQLSTHFEKELSSTWWALDTGEEWIEGLGDQWKNLNPSENTRIHKVWEPLS